LLNTRNSKKEDPPVDHYFKSNRDLWDELTPLHEKAESYDVDGFKAGKCTLRSIELNEVGEVKGKSLLHLQCHFGLDTLSWARLGAKTTGVDFSEKAIGLARSLSCDVGLRTDFICANIYDMPDVLKGEFDIVFTSYGVLCWLPDLKRWAEIIAHFLKPGGFFYIVEGHPFLPVFDNSEKATEFKVTESYFHKPEPIKWEPEGDYTDRSAEVVHPSYEWTHNLGDVINSLIQAGLRIDFLHEFPLSAYRWSPFTEKKEDGWWHAPGDKVPLTFSLKATRLIS
jgi:SAM-dependent methyltransferase